MKFRALPGTDLVLSEVGLRLRTAQRYARERHDELSVDRILRRAYDDGITYFDFSDAVVDHEMESRFADTISAHRPQLVLSQAYTVELFNNSEDGSNELTKMCEESLR